MNAKNRKLLESLENAIGEYSWTASLDGQHNVSWSEDTDKAHKKLRALLLELERALP